MLELLTNPDAWIALATLTLLEIVLGIDNIVFIAILASRLPVEKQALAYRLGLLGAMVTRVALLLTINWVMQLTEPLFEILKHSFSGRDLILLGGGLFLIAKSRRETSRVGSTGLRAWWPKSWSSTSSSLSTR
jgi:predicted tellurium resistance membrane protein TerC